MVFLIEEEEAVDEFTDILMEDVSLSTTIAEAILFPLKYSETFLKQPAGGKKICKDCDCSGDDCLCYHKRGLVYFVNTVVFDSWYSSLKNLK
jgi:hypothetical protein